MDLKKLSTPLKISYIDFRVQSINKGGYATLIPYKDARVDMNRLDEVCGASNWQRDHKEVKGVVYCGIGINVEFGDDTNERIWVWKWDAGSESNNEAEKGQASDSFKRAGFNWGIGRELYDYPIIQVKLNPNEFKVENNKTKQTWELRLREWRWKAEFAESGEVSYLGAIDNHNKLRFEYKIK